MSATEIIAQIEKLPLAERQEVAELLMEKYGNFDDELTPELTPGQIAELERRAEEFRKNPRAGIPWEQVRDEARKRFGWK